ncbi:MAG TPA: RluA family pseudouridine synthase [Candidatus Limnocylindrales bacterium]|nr:RluA family pseudouridine synthase [Candidatus Limnocylindrales bacterium]
MNSYTDLIKIIHEDDELLIVDKPAGITVNKSETTVNEITVQDWAEHKLKINSEMSDENSESDFYNRGGIVHRLDKETSGILLIAKSESAFINLQKQFKERTIKKTYVSLAHGKISPDKGEINVPVGRLPWNRKQFGIIPGGRESRTDYKVLQHIYISKLKEYLSLVELYPQSGRTHQIRVHLKYIGHPIFSDFLYAGRKTSRKDRKVLPRVFLHAAGISFLHPKNQKNVSFSSGLPSELTDAVEHLQDNS